MTTTQTEAERGRPLVECDNVVRIFTSEGVEVVALQGLDLSVAAGELVAVVGASGSGKSTLLRVLSGLDRPTAGAARVAGHDLVAMRRRERLRFRRETVGFLYQQASDNLLPYLTAAENVAVPMRLAGRPREEVGGRVSDLLGLLGLAECADRRLAELSGGQQQRVGLAVALANHPQVLLADEPTGELDTRTADDVFAAIRTANAELGVTVVVVTHDQAVSGQVQRTVGIRDGRTSSEVLRRTEVDAEGRSALVSEEYAVLDRAGRLQLPREFTHALELRDRVRLDLESDHIGVWPGHDGATPRTRRERAALTEDTEHTEDTGHTGHTGDNGYTADTEGEPGRHRRHD
ncbi:MULTISPECIES: ABC transporter ATP-binding protein [Arsenicicoccus]|uniref:ABC transporter ATP-binding protein n=1 Tax=Arsenicicoccus TaxID=267408 RepID=UPI00257A9473|nr:MULTISPECIES: ABC transporter ATP-binding protein [Arsenicicoccus]